MTTPIVSVDELCKAIEQLHTEHLEAQMAQLGFEVEKLRTWQQVPSLEALQSAALPAGAIVAPGLVNPPTYKASSNVWVATWRVLNGIYVKGRDHGDTQAQVRNWCAGIRTNLLKHKSLGGIAADLKWFGEEYDRLPSREAARTIAAGGVAVDVTVHMTLDPAPADRPVLKTPTSVSVR